jgi:hypothetical protein
VTENSHLALFTHALQAWQLWTQSVSSEGHFTLETESVFRPYLASHYSGVTQTSNMAVPPHAPQPVEGWSKSGSNEGHFTLEAETVFRP